MAVHRTYCCDLCRRGGENTELIGIYWTGMDKIEVRSRVSVEHHLCRKCIEEIKKIDLTKLESVIK